MSDSKDRYSTTSAAYTHSEHGKAEHDKSKAREAKHNENWKKQSVNLNEIVDKYAPGAIGEQRNGKFIYFGDKYNVIADMSSGYLRIMDNETKEYISIDGHSRSDKKTHYKIKRREEM